MEPLGDALIDAENTPCRVCGQPLSLVQPEGMSGIFCQYHNEMHMYHDACLRPEQQVEIMIAKMKGRGIL
jgi:hypothetical protein